MLRWRGVSAVTLAAAVFAVAPGTAVSAPTEQIDVLGAEVVGDFLLNDELNVTGTGVCGMFGPVFLNVSVQDIETGAMASGRAVTQCMFAGEQIRWVVTANVSHTIFQFRPGDRVNIVATAVDAINGTDEKQTTLKQFH